MATVGCDTFGRVDRVCRCGCGVSLEGFRPNAIYATAACKSRAWRRKHGYRVVGVRKRSQKPKQERSGVSVYLPDLEVARETLRRCSDMMPAPAREALTRAIERRERRA